MSWAALALVFAAAAIIELKSGVIGRALSNLSRASWGRESSPRPFFPKQITAAWYTILSLSCLIKAIFYFRS